MIKLDIKPLSVNMCWQGKRFKTSNYKDYEQLLFILLPKKLYIPKDKIELHLLIGVSSKASDIDNILKPFIDILQQCYGFNDKKIYKIEIEKEDVEKGREFISFELNDYE